MVSDAFEHSVLAGRGRALVASRGIRPGEEVLREQPAAFVASSDNNAEDCHRMLAKIIHAASLDRYRQPIADLVCMQERFRAADPDMLRELSASATPAVAALLARWHGAEAAASVTEQAVIDAFCKHALNSMTVLTPESCSREVGMALYPTHGALMNHADLPNCWTMFEADADADAASSESEGESYSLVVRCLAPIAAGEEITISYLDPGQALSERHAQLQSQYFIPPPPAAAAHTSPLPLADPAALQRIAASPLYVSGCSLYPEPSHTRAHMQAHARTHWHPQGETKGSGLELRTHVVALNNDNMLQCLNMLEMLT